MARLKNVTKNQVLAENVVEAKLLSFRKRTKGLIGSTRPPEGQVLWILFCNSIHTFFMKFPIDVVFVDKKLQVKQVNFGVKPWSMILPVWGASSAFEFESGKLDLADVEIGDQLYVGN